MTHSFIRISEEAIQDVPKFANKLDENNVTSWDF